MFLRLQNQPISGLSQVTSKKDRWAIKVTYISLPHNVFTPTAELFLNIWKALRLNFIDNLHSSNFPIGLYIATFITSMTTYWSLSYLILCNVRCLKTFDDHMTAGHLGHHKAYDYNVATMWLLLAWHLFSHYQVHRIMRLLSKPQMTYNFSFWPLMASSLSHFTIWRCWHRLVWPSSQDPY